LIVYAFDVDDTLEISGGPVSLQSLINLRAEGHVVGLCGNWAVFCRGVENWHHLISFMNAGTPDKETLLCQLKKYVPAADFVLVGNVPGVSGASDDQGAAQRAGWRFISETEFAEGKR
jgi:hypothetical protein